MVASLILGHLFQSVSLFCSPLFVLLSKPFNPPFSPSLLQRLTPATRFVGPTPLPPPPGVFLFQPETRHAPLSQHPRAPRCRWNRCSLSCWSRAWQASSRLWRSHQVSHAHGHFPSYGKKGWELIITSLSLSSQKSAERFARGLPPRVSRRLREPQRRVQGTLASVEGTHRNARYELPYSMPPLISALIIFHYSGLCQAIHGFLHGHCGVRFADRAQAS